MPGLAALSLSLVVALVLIARPTHELPPVPPVVSLLPPPAVSERPVAVAPSPAARAAEWTPRAAPVRHTRAVLARSVVVERTSFAWSGPSALPRMPISLAYLPNARRIPTPRDTAQSP